MSDVIHLPTQEEDIFQRIPKFMIQKFSMNISEFPNYLIFVEVDNKRTHDVELYEQFIIGAGKMGIEDLINNKKDPINDIMEYSMNNGENDPEGTLYLRVYAIPS